MDVREYARALRRRWMSIVASMMVFVAGALALTLAQPKTYTATATSFVNVTVSTSQDPSAIFQQSQFLVQRMKSYTEAVDSPLVLEPTIKALRLNLSVKQLAAKVSATSPTDTVALEVAATDKAAQRSERIANSVAANLGRFIDKFEAPVGGVPSSVKVTMTIPATVPATPSSPRPTFNLVLGLLAGLAVGVGIAIGRDRLSSAVESADEISEITGANVLGKVLHVSKSRSPLVALDHRSTPSEAYRTICVNLRFANVDQQPRSLVVTSATEGDGKTTVACNLAVAMAESGARVCLVDADLRRPRIGEVLGMDNSAGLTDVLAGEHKIDDVLIRWHDGLVTVLTAGSVPPDPNALLNSRAMTTLLENLRSEFDVVLIDSPPLLPVSDALILGSLSDGVVLVARRGRTNRAHVRAALDSIRLSQSRLFGTILNDVKVGLGPGRRYYGYTDPARTTQDVSASTDDGPAPQDVRHDEPASTESDAGPRKFRSRAPRESQEPHAPYVGSGAGKREQHPARRSEAESGHDGQAQNGHDSAAKKAGPASPWSGAVTVRRR